MNIFQKATKKPKNDGYEMDRARAEAVHESEERSDKKSEDSRKRLEDSLLRLQNLLQEGA